MFINDEHPSSWRVFFNVFKEVMEMDSPTECETVGSCCKSLQLKIRTKVNIHFPSPSEGVDN